MTPFEMAQRFVGEVREIPGEKHHPFIQWCFMLCGWDEDTADEVPWCSVFLNGICWLLRLPRSKSARARSWLRVGISVHRTEARAGFDVVILKRGGGRQPGPDVINAPGHVGLFAGWQTLDLDVERYTHVLVLGGNQGNEVSVKPFPMDRILGIRRLAA